ncbi:MAG: hypothetical protein WBX27_10550 [Specibacter sp.]
MRAPVPVRLAAGKGGALSHALIWVLALGLAGTVLTGCNGPLETVELFMPDPAKLQQKVDCTALSNTLLNRKTAKAVVATMGSIPAGFETVSVVKCSKPTLTGTRAADGTLAPTVIREDHLTGNFAPLLAALAEPSERSEDVACDLMGEVRPELWLVNPAGESVHVQWPLSVCQGSKPAVWEALAHLKVATTVDLPWPVPS